MGGTPTHISVDDIGVDKYLAVQARNKFVQLPKTTLKWSVKNLVSSDRGSAKESLKETDLVLLKFLLNTLSQKKSRKSDNVI